MEYPFSTLEVMEITATFGGIYQGRKVLLTGHTGFKGSWLAWWLHRLGAEVHGLALPPETDPAHIQLLDFPVHSIIQDINDKAGLEKAMTAVEPEIIFHLAAQPLVRLSYAQPVETLMTNIMGTAHVLEAARKLKNLKAIVIITSDKCYDNREWLWGYREDEALGGKDPYSASKGCAEIITASYRNSFFNPETWQKDHQVLVASARAGNVIGGGDWAADRIVPDMVKAASGGETVYLRYPGATRPWQHVLEPLSGYLNLGWKLLAGEKEYAEAWNFGPESTNNVSVLELVRGAAKVWDEIRYDFNREPQPHEAGFLMLDSTKAKKRLAWSPVWDFQETLGVTIGWYMNYYRDRKLNTASDLERYVRDAHKKGIAWAI